MCCNNIFKCLLMVMLLPVFPLSAQVVSTATGYPVIDLSALEPLGALLSSSEAAARRTEMNAQTPTNDVSLPVGGDENGVWNAKMSIKYQVMRTDRSTGTDRANAWALCKSYNGEGGGAGQWRLPTQRELEMIWILHPQLINKASFTAFSANYYWAATEYTGTSGWAVRFSDGYTNSNTKTSSTYVRCVRDL